MAHPSLTDAQRAEYDEQGFLVLPRLFEDAELEPWRRRFAEIVNGEVAPAEDMLVMRDVMVAKGAVAARMATIAPRWNFRHIPDDVLPALREEGVSEPDVVTMTVENPRRIFEQQGAY